MPAYQLALHGGEALGEHGDNLVEVAHDAEVGDAEDGGELVFVDGDDEFALLHACEVLDGAADAAGHVEGRADGLAGLADLAAGVHDAGVDHGAAAGDFAAELLGEGAELAEAVLGANAAAAADEDLGLADVGDGLLFLDGLDELHAVDFLDVEVDVEVGDDALAAGVGGHLLHDAGADGGHLRAVVLAEDGGHEVASEGGTGHAELVGLVVADFELGGVGGEAGAVACADAGAEVAADGGGADEHDAGFALGDDGGDGLGIGLGEVVLQQVVVDHEDLVGAVLDEGGGEGLDVLAEEHGDDLLLVGVGQFAGLAQQLEGHILQFAVALLGKHVNVFIFC